MFLTAKNAHIFASSTTLSSTFQARHVYHDHRSYMTTTELTIIKIHGLPRNFQMLETFEHANIDHTRINDIPYNGLICGRNVFLTMDQSTGTDTKPSKRY